MTARVIGWCALGLLLWQGATASGQDDLAGPDIEVPAAAAAPTSPIGLTNEQLTRRLVALELQMNALADNLTETITQVGQLKGEVNELRDRISEEIEKQRQILDAISSVDSQGQRIPRLSAIMNDSPEFKQDVTNAVNNALLQEGTFEIINKTDSYQRIYVNRTEQGVEAGKSLTLKVPVGTVTTQLPGKSLENWSITAPSYSEKIEIVPADPPVTSFQPVYYYVLP
ncbi:MAG: hypothetical protein R3C99_27720 [Pirellulaceae bacterium]|nr:hypothetical protein [Planctomycetales bacterium]MCA9203708.1 hypothetical protein [Planctomycetales bacterium]